ncbi:MAG TPA: class 1 fructose-bisphosphatase [Methylophilaceae bacterium]|nr:class 1 fructose-bisphosphatase [Methylophilaceae bacterium]
MTEHLVTLADFLTEQLKDFPQTEALNKLLVAIASASKEIAAMTAKGALTENTAKLASQNVQGETQMKLDVLANDAFIRELKASGSVAGIVSEEMDDPLTMTTGSPFLVVFDPLDGSSNVPVNVSVGSIFSVLNAPQAREPEVTDYLQAGSQQVAAGYALYGPCTMLVLTVGLGTHGFTYEADRDAFLLTHFNMQMPDETTEFAINASNARFWDAPVQRYVENCQAGITGPRGKDFNMRWVASMVADVHRILIRGGVYLYPKDTKLPTKEGRLRLLYEVNPMSMLVEQAGGKSSTGRQRMLDVIPDQVHQRIAVLLGTRQEVTLLERYYQEFDAGVPNKSHSPLFSDRSLFNKKQ